MTALSTRPVAREMIHCTQDGCRDTGCQAVLMSDGTVIIANLGVSFPEIQAADLAEIMTEHPSKGLVKGNLEEIYDALTRLRAQKAQEAA